MTTVIVHHEVKDYPAWRQVFDKVQSLRKEGGELSADIYRDAANPSAVTGVFRWKDEGSARAYFSDDRLKAAMVEAGVVGPPTIHFLSEA